MHRAQRVKHYLQNRLGDMAGLLERLVRLESPSLDPQSQQPVLSLLEKRLKAADMKVEAIPGNRTGGHLLAYGGSQAKGQAQLMVGHCDTVWPLGTLKKMPIKYTDGRITGPGVYDMKAGLVQMVFALEALRDLKIPAELAPVVFINSDEEVGSFESTPHIQSAAQNADRAFILEPSLGREGRLKTRRKGIGGYKIRALGKAAHAGLDPGKGASAILELSHVIQTLFALNDAERGVTINVGTIDGGLRPNVVAPEACAQVDVRVLTLADAVAVEDAILSLKPAVPGVRLEIEGGFGRAPMEMTPRNQRLWEKARELAAELEFELLAGVAGGGSDGNTTSLFTATLDGLGAVGDGAHSEHEFIYQQGLVERTALLTLLLASPPERTDP